MDENRPEPEELSGDESELNIDKETPVSGEEIEPGTAGGAEDGEDEEKEAKSKINWRNVIIGAVAFIIIIAVTLIFLRFTTELRFKELPGLFMRLNGGWVAFSLVCLAGYIYCEGRAMAAAGRAIGVRFNRWRSSVYASVELFFSALTPSASGGQPAAAYFMSKDGIKLSKSSVILLNNTLHYTLTLLVLSCFSLIWHGSFIFSPDRGRTFVILFVMGFIANILGLLSCLLFIFAPGLVRTLFTPIYRLLARMHIIKDLDKSLASFEKAVEEYGECQKLIRRSPSAQLQTFFWNLMQRICNFTIAYCIYRALGFDEKSVIDIIVIQILVVMAVNALPLPGAVGASEMIHKGLYIWLYHEEKMAVNAMLFSRGISFYLMVVIVGVISVTYYINILKKKRRLAGQTGPEPAGKERRGS